jgi:hypothetical protein
MSDEFIKDLSPSTAWDVKVEGITAEYVWYHSKLLTNSMDSWQLEFKRVVDVMEARHNEHLDLIAMLLRQNEMLKEKLRSKE